MNKQPDVYLELALLALERVPRFLADRTRKAYLDDELCQSAVERQLEIAGDALGQLRKLDPELFARIPEGPLIVAFRNVLAHGYATLDHHRVFDAATTKVATLSAAIRKLLEEFPTD
jgi:uncharacterized protein with HEPN domain